MKRLIAAGLTAAATLALATAAAGASAMPADAVLTALPMESSPLTAMVTDLTPEIASASSTVSATVTLDNGGAVPVDDAVITLSVTAAPLADAEDLDAFVDDPASYTLRSVAQNPEPPEPDPESDADATADDTDQPTEIEPEEPLGIAVSPGSRSTVTVTAAAPELSLPAGSWGVYGLVVELETGGDTTVVDAIPLTWADAEVPSLDIAVLASATGTGTRIDSILQAADIDGAAVALDPTEISSATVFEQRLMERDVYRLPAGVPDLTSLAHADDDEVLALSLSLPPSTTVGTLGEAPWLAIPAAIDASTAALSARHGAAAMLATPGAPGFEDVATANASSVSVGDGAATVIVPDARLSAVLADYRPGTPAATAMLVAESALAAAEGTEEPLLIAPGANWRLGATGVSAPLAALADAPWISVVPVSDLMKSDPRSIELASTLDTDNDVAALTIEALAERIDDLRTLAATTALPGLALTDWGAPIARSIPTSLRGNTEPRRVAIAEGLAAADATLDGVRIAESSDLNLLADSGDVPVTVINELDRPVTVTVDLASLSPNLQVENHPVATVPGGQELLVPVTVEAVSSGNVTVSVVLRGPEGDAVSDVSRFSIRIRADWGTAATAGFTVLLVLLLIAGLVRTVRRGRKDTRTRAGSASEAAHAVHEPSAVAGADARAQQDDDAPAQAGPSGTRTPEAHDD